MVTWRIILVYAFNYEWSNNKNQDNKVTMNGLHIKYTNLFCLALLDNFSPLMNLTVYVPGLPLKQSVLVWCFKPFWLASLKFSSRLIKNNAPIGIIIGTRASGGKDLVGVKKRETYIDLSLTRKKYLQSDWLRGVQYWPYLYSVFNICTPLLNKKKSTFDFCSGKIEMYSLKTN